MNLSPEGVIVKGGTHSPRVPTCGSRAESSALPCLYSNNCTDRIGKGLAGDRIGRVYQRIDGEIGQKLVQGYQRKAAHVLNLNVRRFMETHGRER